MYASPVSTTPDRSGQLRKSRIGFRCTPTYYHENNKQQQQQQQQQQHHHHNNNNNNIIISINNNRHNKVNNANNNNITINKNKKNNNLSNNHNNNPQITPKRKKNKKKELELLNQAPLSAPTPTDSVSQCLTPLVKTAFQINHVSTKYVSMNTTHRSVQYT